MRNAQQPFRDSVIKRCPSRHAGLEVTVCTPRHGPRFRAYVHTPAWERVLVVSTATTAEGAMERAEALLTQAVGEGVDVRLPAPSRRSGTQPQVDARTPT